MATNTRPMLAALVTPELIADLDDLVVTGPDGLKRSDYVRRACEEYVRNERARRAVGLT